MSGRSLSMASLPAPLSLLSGTSAGYVSNPLICQISWHQLVALLFLSTGFLSVTLDGSSARPDISFIDNIGSQEIYGRNLSSGSSSLSGQYNRNQHTDVGEYIHCHMLQGAINGEENN